MVIAKAREAAAYSTTPTITENLNLTKMKSSWCDHVRCVWREVYVVLDISVINTMGITIKTETIPEAKSGYWRSSHRLSPSDSRLVKSPRATAPCQADGKR
eukprot:c18060_g1_i1.p3 GENE.c18060_g1_i1~~c18060_g1_i1.p3  ORF type:complete len:101 (+),score=17.83 c18060_g1_i1:188-490(+)